MSILALSFGLVLGAMQDVPPFSIEVVARERIAEWPASDAPLQLIAITQSGAYFVSTESVAAWSPQVRAFDLLEIRNDPTTNRRGSIAATVERLVVFCDRRTIQLIEFAGFDLHGRELVFYSTAPEMQYEGGSPYDLAGQVVCPSAEAQPPLTSVVGPEAAIALANDAHGRP